MCLEAATGKERWRKNLPRDFGGQVMSDWKFSRVAAHRRRPRRGDPRRRRRRDGRAEQDAPARRSGRRRSPASARHRGRDGAGYSSIVISNGAGVKQYVQLLGRGVIGVRASDGEYLWGYNRVANNVANIPTPIVQGDFVFAVVGLPDRQRLCSSWRRRRAAR